MLGLLIKFYKNIPVKWFMCLTDGVKLLEYVAKKGNYVEPAVSGNYYITCVHEVNLCRHWESNNSQRLPFFSTHHLLTVSLRASSLS